MRPATLGLFLLFALLSPLRADADAFVPGVEADARILRAFRQAEPDDRRTNPEIAKRDYGNCDSIALIKAAMATFGDAEVLSSVTSTLDDGRIRPGMPSTNDGRTYSVTLRDGRPVSVTREEVEIAVHDRAVNSGFHAGADEPSRVVTFEANFLYAVMAKHMTLPDAKAIALFAGIDGGRLRRERKRGPLSDAPDAG